MHTRPKPAPAEPTPEFVVRRAEERDDPALVGLLQENVTTEGAVPRYQWIYRKNPQGPACAWLACSSSTGEILGVTSIFAREFSIDGKAVMGGVGFDAFVRPTYRRRGIALALHQASRLAMDRG